MLELGGTVSRIKQLEKPADVLKTGLYVTKDRDNKDLRAVVQKYLGWGSNINVWVNQRETQNAFHLIADRINPVFVSKELYMWSPTTRKHQDKGFILAELFYKLFKLLNLAARDEYVYRKIDGTRFSWEKQGPLENWIANMFNLTAP